VIDLCSKKLYASRTALPKLQENEYYFEDLMGLFIATDKANFLGTVTGVFDYGAGVFLEIKLHDTNKLATLPFSKNSVLEVDLENKRIIIIDKFLLR
jgi:16S rRNA processing protein RimM